MLDFILGLLDACKELFALLPPSSNVLLFFFQLTLLNVNVLAHSAFISGMSNKRIVDQLHTATFAHSVLSGATLLHISPLPVTAAICSLLVIAHPGDLAAPTHPFAWYRPQ